MDPTRRTRNCIGLMVAAAAAVSTFSIIRSHSLDVSFGLMVLVLAAATSRMKVKLPGVNGNMSVNLPFLLTAIVSLSAAEAVVITCISTLVQCWPKKGAKFNFEQMIFNLSMMTFATCLANVGFRASSSQSVTWSVPVALGVATATLLLGQTIPVAAIVSVSEGRPTLSIFRNLLQLSFPYYVVSAGIVSMVEMVGSRMGWPLALGVFPVMYGVHASYRFYFGKMTEAAPAPVLVRAAHA